MYFCFCTGLQVTQGNSLPGRGLPGPVLGRHSRDAAQPTPAGWHHMPLRGLQDRGDLPAQAERVCLRH